jgi:hypothetical protein
MQGTPRQMVAMRRGTSVHIPKEEDDDEVGVIEALLLLLMLRFMVMIVCYCWCSSIQIVSWRCCAEASEGDIPITSTDRTDDQIRIVPKTKF